MPRNGSNVYSADWVNATPNVTIESAKQNAMVADFVADANAARPITAGGTGATTAIGAADNLFTKSSDVASAATTDLSTATGMYVVITGTTTITAFGTEAAGVTRTLRFSGALTLTHNATSLILPGAANITTAAGDTAVFVSEGSGNWRCLTYQRAAPPPFSFQSGSWTPGLLFGGNNSGMTIASAVGSYVKIGPLVVLQFTMTLSAKGVSTGTATIPNMPFTPAASVLGSGAAFLNDGGFAGLTAGMIFHVSAGSTALGMRLPRTTGTGGITDANFTDAASLGGTIVYIATA